MGLATANFNQSTESVRAQEFQVVRAEDHGPKHRGGRTRGHGHKQQFNAAYVELKRENFQPVVDGKNTDLCAIKNDRGMFVKITNLGAQIAQLVVPDRDCTFSDVVLG